jgi:putative membrane protein
MGLMTRGLALPPADSWTWVVQWRIAPWTVVPIAVAGWLYASGLRRARRIGARFPRSRPGWFFGGLGALVLALVSPVDAYADVSFTVHMVQHLLLTLVAAPLLALGAPISLALRVLTPPARHRIASVLRSRPASVVANPVVGWLGFIGVPVAIHMSSLFDLALRSGTVHAAEHALWFTAALIYWWPIVGRDPSPHPVPYPARLLSLFLAMPAGSFLALAIASAPNVLYPTYGSLPDPWGVHALGDQHVAAVTMWLIGDLALVVAMLFVAVAWRRDEESHQRRLEAARRPRSAVEPGA